MTAVAASPSTVQHLARTLAAGAETLLVRSRGLSATLEQFRASRSEYGPTDSPVPQLLDSQHREALKLSSDLEQFVASLRAADDAGATLAIGRLLSLSATDVLLMDEADLALFRTIDHSTTVSDLLDRARADRDRHVARRPELTVTALPQQRAWHARLNELRNRLTQLDALLDPPHDRWAGATRSRWVSALSLLDALDRGQQQAQRDVGADPPAQDHPFLSTALENGVLLTPARVDILNDLDRLATMALDDFVGARANAVVNYPVFDWTSDGCSGPVPAQARDACLRHDFLYRNARMIRDQWGTGSSLAVDIKRYADSAFGNEIRASYAWWERILIPGLTVWTEGAEAAVTLLGDVGQPWSPPQEGGFFGSAQPD